MIVVLLTEPTSTMTATDLLAETLGGEYQAVFEPGRLIIRPPDDAITLWRRWRADEKR